MSNTATHSGQSGSSRSPLASEGKGLHSKDWFEKESRFSGQGIDKLMVLANTTSTAIPVQTPLRPTLPAGIGNLETTVAALSGSHPYKQLARSRNSHQQTTPPYLEILDPKTSPCQNSREVPWKNY